MATIKRTDLAEIRLLRGLRSNYLNEMKWLRVFFNRVIFSLMDNSVYSYGDNQHGLSGGGNARHSRLLIRIYELSGSDVLDIAAGREHVLLLASGGRVVSWGRNADGQLGTGNSIGIARSRNVINDGIVAIATGSYHSMALTNRGKVLTWGSNEHGCLGVGKHGPRKITLPWEMPLGDNFIVSIASGPFHSLALNLEGQIFGWGSNHCGQLGGEGHSYFWSAYRINTLEIDRFKLIAGGDHFSLFITEENLTVTQENFGLKYGFPVSQVSIEKVHITCDDYNNPENGSERVLALRSDGIVDLWYKNFIQPFNMSYSFPINNCARAILNHSVCGEIPMILSVERQEEDNDNENQGNVVEPSSER